MNKNPLPLRVGVGIALLNSKNKIFVGKRIDNPKSFWQMPQGGVDINEKLAAKYPYQRAYLPVNRLEDGTMWNW